MTYTLLIKCIFFILFLLIIKFKLFNKTDICISLIIPSRESDFIRCYRNFFLYYRNFIFVKEIIIVVSSVSNISKLHYIINNFKYRNKIIIAIRKAPHNAASNRNFGYKLSICEIISFFDIDDIMSENRLPVIYSIFKNDKSTEIILHKYTQSCKELITNSNSDRLKIMNYNLSYGKIRDSYNKINNKVSYKYAFCCKYIEEIKNEKISNGWSSMRRYLFNKIQFNFSINIGEDSEFNMKAILLGFNLTLVNMSLGYYIRDNTCMEIC